MPFDKTQKDKTKDLYYYARECRGLKTKWASLKNT
jgi:hypothetical protein